MPVYKVQGPDGKVYTVEGPNGATAEQLGMAINEHYSDAQIRGVAQRRADRKTYDPTKGMEATDLALAGLGSWIKDKQIGAKQLLNPNSKELKQELREKRQLDQPLEQTTAGTVGKMVGPMGTAALSMALPGMQGYAGAATAGAVGGLTDPTEDGLEGKLRSGALGGLAGIAGQGVGNAIGRAASPVQSQLNPEQARLMQLALREGIPLDAAAQTGSKPLLTLNSVLANLPLTAGREAEKQQGAKEAYNRAVLQRSGIQGENLATPPVLAQRKSDLGAQFEDIAGRNSIDFTQNNILGRLGNIQTEAERRLSHPGPIVNTVDDIIRDVSANGNSLPGLKYQGWRGTLRNMSSPDTEGKLAGDIKRVLDREFTGQVSGADGAAWQEASRNYANLKTTTNAMGGAGNEAASGNIPPAQLANALRSSVGTEGKALGRGDLNDLSKIGQLFVRDNTPNSGTAQRQMWQSLLTGGAGSAGGVGALAAGADPSTAAMVAGGTAGASLAIPRLVQSLVNRPGVQNYLANGVQSDEIRALAEALRRTAPAAAIGSYSGE